MTVTHNALRLIGVCICACLMLVTYGVSTADASEWRIGPKTLTERGESKTSALISVGESLTLSIPWYEVEVTCTSASTKNELLFPGGTSTGTWSLSGCTLKGPPFISETCKLIEPLEANLKGSLALHKTRTYQKFEAEKEGSPLLTVKFKEGTECPLPLSNQVTGTLAAETKTPEQIKRTITFNSTVAELIGAAIEFGGHPATLKGSLILTLGAVPETAWTGIAGPPSKEELLQEWAIGGPTLTNWELKETGLSGSASKVLLSAEISTLFKLQCTSATLDSFVIKTGGLMTGTVLFGTCSVFYTGEKNPACAPKASPTAKVKGKLVLGGGKSYVLFEAAEGAKGLVTFTIPPECPFEGEQVVTGTVVASCEGSCESEATSRSLVVDPSVTGKLFPTDVPKFGGGTAKLEFTLGLSLASPFAGVTWSGIG